MIKSYKSLSVQAKASIWYTICNFFQNGISLIVVPIYIRLLTTADYGRWSVFQSWRDILIIFASLNLYCGVYTKTLVDIKDDRDRYTSSMQGLGTVISLIMIVVYFCFHDWYNGLMGLDTLSFLLLFLYFIVFPAFSFWSARQRVEYKYRAVVIVTVIISVLTPALSLFFVIFKGLGAKGLILGYLISQSSVGSFFYIYHFIKGKCFVDLKYWKYAVRFNIPLIPHYLSLIVLGQSDRIMIKEYCGESEAGIYSFAYQLASVIIILISAIDGSRVPWTYEQLRDRVYDRLREITDYLCAGFGIVNIGIALLAPDVINVLGTADYRPAMYVIPVVTLSVYFTFVYDLFCSVEFYYGETQYVMIASIVGAVSNILLNFWLIPIFGYLSAAYTTLISYIILALVHYCFMLIVMKKYNIQKVYDLRFIFIISICLSVLVLSTMFIYKISLLRYIILAGMGIALFFFREKISYCIRTVKTNSEEKSTTSS